MRLHCGSNLYARKQVLSIFGKVNDNGGSSENPFCQWYCKLSGRVGAVALALISALTSALTLLFFLFGLVMCGRHEFPPVSSGEGRLIAQVSEEDCGATDSFHSSVQLCTALAREARHLGPPVW